MQTTLFDPAVLGELPLANRIAMAPMTRSRADADGVINASAAEYYGARAGAGLIITEGINVHPCSNAFDRAPGLWTDEQAEGWRSVVDRVHRTGGRIVAQLWHAGRASTSGLLGGREPPSPSGVREDLNQLQVWGMLANGAYVKILATPARAMTVGEIADAINAYRVAAANAMRVGFDGVEIHGANGYLIPQFLSATLNTRDDEYGGDITKRARFLREVVAAVLEVVPPGRVGLRLSPYATYNNVRDPDIPGTYGRLASWLNDVGLAYLHLADTNAWAGEPDYSRMLELFRPFYTGKLMVNAGITPERAAIVVGNGEADVVAFGRLFLANPDLPARIRAGGPYNQQRQVGVYGGSDVGYLDYPTLDG